MMNPEVVRQLHAMFDAHNAAFAEIRRANAAMRDATVSIGVAFDAHEAAIDRALAANQAAIDLLNALTE